MMTIGQYEEKHQVGKTSDSHSDAVRKLWLKHGIEQKTEPEWAKLINITIWNLKRDACKKNSMSKIESSNQWYRLDLQGKALVDTSGTLNVHASPMVDGRKLDITLNGTVCSISLAGSDIEDITELRFQSGGSEARATATRQGNCINVTFASQQLTMLADPNTTIDLYCYCRVSNRRSKHVLTSQISTPNGEETVEFDTPDETETVQPVEDVEEQMSPRQRIQKKIQAILATIGVSLTDLEMQVLLATYTDDPLDWFRDIGDKLGKNRITIDVQCCSLQAPNGDNPFAACYGTNDRVLTKADDQVLFLRYVNRGSGPVHFVVNHEFSNITKVVGVQVKGSASVAGKLPAVVAPHNAAIQATTDGVELTFDGAALSALQDTASSVTIEFKVLLNNWFVSHLNIPAPAEIQDLPEQWRPPDLQDWVDVVTSNGRHIVTPRALLEFVFAEYLKKCGFKLNNQETLIGVRFHMDRMKEAEIAGAFSLQSSDVDAVVEKLQKTKNQYVAYRLGLDVKKVDEAKRRVGKKLKECKRRSPNGRWPDGTDDLL